MVVTTIPLFAQDFQPPQEGIYGSPDGTGKGIVGALGGTIDISAMGSAVYTIPITLPEGINGMTPSLSIVYNSQMGNGMLGWGWNLTGASAITRIGHTLYHDGDMKGVNFDDDRFALDGQRLMLVNDKMYGQNEAEYRTEVDQMSKIVSYKSSNDTTKGPAWFKVWHADGTIAYYGTRYDSRIGLRQANDACFWLLDSVTDRNGNYMVYHYNYYGGSSYTLGYIDYTGHDAGNPATAKKPFYRVQFTYVDREDEETFFIGNRAFHQNRLLTSIKVLYAAYDEIERYDFEYFGSNTLIGNNYPRLKKIHYDCRGEKYNPTIIQWNNYYSGSSSYTNNVFIGTERAWLFGGKNKFAADFNGDGLSDILLLQNDFDNIAYSAEIYLNDGKKDVFIPFEGDESGLSFHLVQTIPVDKSHSFNLNWIYVADFNNDGLDDFAAVYRKTGTFWDYVSIDFYLTELSGEEVRIVKADSDLDGEKFKIGGTHGETLLIGDFLGKGRTDAMMQIPEKTVLLVGTIKPKLLYITCNENNRFVFDYYDNDQVLPGKKFTAADYNGDGITEIWCSNDSRDVLDDNRNEITNRSNATMMVMTGTHSCRQFNTGYMLSNYHQLFLDDFNGDGKKDLLTYVTGDNGAIGTWQVNYFKETGLYWSQFDITDEMPIDDPGNRSFSLSARLNTDFQFIETGDYNGDGKADLTVVANDSLYFFFGPLVRIEGSSTKARFSSKQVVNRQEAFGYCYSSQTMVSGNFMGTANRSLFSGWYYYYPSPIFDRYNVFSVTDGMGNRTSFSYSYLMPNYDCYTLSRRYQELNKRIYALPIPKMMLVSVANTNVYAATPTVSTKYLYNTALFHRDGRGFLGFAETTVSTYLGATLQNKTISTYGSYEMKNHNALVLCKERSYGTNGNLMSETVYHNDYLEHWKAKKVFVPVVTKQETTSYSLDDGSILNKTITENRFHKDGLSLFCGYYYQTVKLDVVLEGVTDDPQVSNVSDCLYQTTKTTNYERETEVLLKNWIVNRPLSSVIKAIKLDEDDASATYITYEYKNNTSYLVKSVTTYPGGNISNQNELATSTIYSYDEAGNVTFDTLRSLAGDLPDRITAYEYKNYRFGIKTVDPSGFVTEGMYNDNYGEITKSWDINGQVTDYWRRDHLGSTEWVKYPDKTYGCTAKRWSITESDAPENAAYYIWKRISGGSPEKVFYDAAGRILRTVTYGLHEETIYKDTKYNTVGLVDSVSFPYFLGDPIYWVKYDYDAFHRNTLVTNPDTTTISKKYDGLITITSINPKPGSDLPSQSKTTVCNILNLVVKSTENNNESNSVTYEYYPDGKLKWTQVGPDEKTRISLKYDDAGNRSILHDPNYGTVKEAYNAFKELKKTTTPKGDSTIYEYDRVGRMITRYEYDHTEDIPQITHWMYSDEIGEYGLLKLIEYGAEQEIHYGYDHLLRPTHIAERILTREYSTVYNYDGYSRINKTVYPSGFVSMNVYSETGVLESITDGEGMSLWKANKVNALGKTTEYEYGNGSTNVRVYESHTGRLCSMLSEDPEKKIQHFGFVYDDFANLASRTDSVFGMQEDFIYDDWNRLKGITLTSQGISVYSEMTYDELGRMKSKQRDGLMVFSSAEYDYVDENGNVKPHAISSANMEGQPFPTERLDIDYTMFDKVKQIQGASRPLLFDYGFDHQRIRMYDGNEYEKVYVGDCEFVRDSEGSHVLTMLASPTGVFAVAETAGNQTEVHYIYKDNLGSWTATVDAYGNIEEQFSYDAWGNSRDPYTWTGANALHPMFDRGFTGHEHLLDVGLINMNGRLYDPVMSCFLSVDNYVQAPDNSQNFNRYAYCLNNPLKYTDPSGEDFGIVEAAIVVAATVAVAVTNNGLSNTEHGQPFFLNAGSVAATTALQSFISYGIGAAAGGIASQVGRVLFQAGAHFVLDGSVAQARGGDFWTNGASGAVSSLISSGTQYLTRGTSVRFQRTAVVASGVVSAGLTSKMMGGDFAEGALNGLITAGLNHAMHLTLEGEKPYRRILKNHATKYKHHWQTDIINPEGRCKAATAANIGYYFDSRHGGETYYWKRFESLYQVDKNVTLEEYFVDCGFNFENAGGMMITKLFEKLPEGKMVVFEMKSEGKYSGHTISLTGVIRENNNSDIMFHISDPMNFSEQWIPYNKEFYDGIKNTYIINGIK